MSREMLPGGCIPRTGRDQAEEVLAISRQVRRQSSASVMARWSPTDPLLCSCRRRPSLLHRPSSNSSTCRGCCHNHNHTHTHTHSSTHRPKQPTKPTSLSRANTTSLASTPISIPGAATAFRCVSTPHPSPDLICQASRLGRRRRRRRHRNRRNRRRRTVFLPHGPLAAQGVCFKPWKSPAHAGTVVIMLQITCGDAG